MGKKEELIEFIHEELDNIYCYNCKHQDDCENDECHRKYMGWQVSDGVVDKIVEIAFLDNQQTDEVEPVRHGKWIYSEDEYGDDGYFCSVCHGHEMWKYGTEPIDFIEAYHYCPFCGAKMGA